MPANIDPDAALMLRVKRGDTGAFAQLVDKYKQPVLNLAFRTLRDATEAEDLAQNVFSGLQIRPPLQVLSEVLHLAVHNRPQSLPERNPPPLADPG